MNNQQIRRSELVKSLLKILTYLLLFASFYGLMSINNWYLLTLSRTAATTMLTYVFMFAVMNSVYGGYAVGKRKSKPVISSMSLAVIITDLAAYLQLQIMNVNENNNSRLELFSSDFLYLLLVIAVQVVIVTIFVRLGNNMYFRINPPQNCCLILGGKTDEAAILRKINIYRLQYQVRDIAHIWDPEVNTYIMRSDTVFLCGITPEQRGQLLSVCYEAKKNVVCVAQLEDIIISNAKQMIIDDAPFLEMEYRTLYPVQRLEKRLFDLAFSSVLTILLSPVMLLSALAIKLCDKGAVFYRQDRVTENGRVFKIIKFRTMTMGDSSENGRHVSAEKLDQRITPIGHFLRKYRIDELPQLFNIIRGDMSLVGPRPEMIENVRYYKSQLPNFKYREKMKAGLTGYAQIEGKYNTSAEDKLMLDLMYIESYSLWLDIKLIFRTLTVFFKPDSTEGFEQRQAPGEPPEQNDKTMQA